MCVVVVSDRALTVLLAARFFLRGVPCRAALLLPPLAVLSPTAATH